MGSVTGKPSKNITVTDPETGLQLTEIFYSLQGEAEATGAPTIFIRLTGCPLRCVYCDTTYSFYGGEAWTISQVLEHIQQYPCKRICLTGGEPLAQKNAIGLMEVLLQNDYEISLETAGALPVKKVPDAVSKVMDIKTPSSGEAHRNFWKNIDFLNWHDQLKFVIADREDYEWSKEILKKYQLETKVRLIWFSPAFDVQVSHKVPDSARDLAQWILDDAIPVRMQLQLHKLLWADAMGK